MGSDGEERMVEGERFSIMEEALRQECKGSICKRVPRRWMIQEGSD